MQPFDYRRPTGLDAALAEAAQPGAVLLAGGTDLLPLWKQGIAAPAVVVDIGRLPLAAITARDDGLEIGAGARLADVARHPDVRGLPALAEAILASAVPQIRNRATVGGNLLQRPRCAYFRTPGLPCNKRQPGSGCGARDGDHRRHAIFGASRQCVAAHASDLAVALVALDARLSLAGPGGARTLPVEALFRPPGDRPERDTTLAAGEMILSVTVPRRRWSSRYLKVRDRAAFDFALVSAAVALAVEDGAIRAARVVAGGVAPMPWRLAACEAALVGARADAEALRAAAAMAGDGAQPLPGNAFKVELLCRLVGRALAAAGGCA